jgi:hypothetical protein
VEVAVELDCPPPPHAARESESAVAKTTR